MMRAQSNYRVPLQQAGFSLVEVLVGMLMGLITILVIFQVFAVFEGQKRTTGSTGDTQMNASQAMMLIERDVRSAGYGFGVAGGIGCKVNASFNGSTFSFYLAPLTITQGSGVQADTINIMGSTNNAFSVPARVTVDHPPTAANFFLDSTEGMNVGDILIAYEPGKDCTMLQVTNIPSGNIQVLHQNTSPWDPPGGQNIFPQPDGYTASGGSMLFNMGSFIDRTYSVAGSSVLGGLSLAELNTSNNTTTNMTLVDGIVNLQAQYGKDTDGNGTVDTWDTVTPTTNAGWQQVIAMRFALAARSPLYEKTVVTASGTAAWAGGGIALTLKPDGSAMPDWDHYRYTVMQTVVPLRNMIWRQ